MSDGMIWLPSAATVGGDKRGGRKLWNVGRWERIGECNVCVMKGEKGWKREEEDVAE